MFDWFFNEFTPAYPYGSSAIKFMVLGTLGEYLGAVLRMRGNWRPFAFWKIVPKLVIWALLGLLVKWAFSSFGLLIQAQAANGLLPAAAGVGGTFWFALAVSTEMNLLFAPFLMASHRVLDNLVDRRWTWAGMHIALYTIFWFWIPAHTITFLLPVNFQILFAAILSTILGSIMGFAARK